MYIPKHFEEPRSNVLHAFIRAHPLAAIVVSDSSGFSADHIPLTIRPSESSPGLLLGHVARSNPLWQKAASGIDCLVIFHGSQRYISPNWYVSKAETGRVVPTWNYEVVHAQGNIRSIDDPEWLRTFLTNITVEHEEHQATPWQLGDAPDEYISRMIQAVVGIRIEITSLVGKMKLSQNQPAVNQQSLIKALHDNGDGSSVEMANAIQGRCDSDG